MAKTIEKPKAEAVVDQTTAPDAPNEAPEGAPDLQVEQPKVEQPKVSTPGYVCTEPFTAFGVDYSVGSVVSTTSDWPEGTVARRIANGFMEFRESV